MPTTLNFVQPDQFHDDAYALLLKLTEIEEAIFELTAQDATVSVKVNNGIMTLTVQLEGMLISKAFSECTLKAAYPGIILSTYIETVVEHYYRRKEN